MNNEFFAHIDTRSLYPGMLKVGDIDEAKPKVEEEWVWVEGYKGTDKDMCCHGYEYKLGLTFTMPDDEDVHTRYSGFHLCPELPDVFPYYPIARNNRFFKVTALVRKSEAIDAGLIEGDKSRRSRYGRANKLAAKSIIFTKEMTIDEIFEAAGYEGYTDDEKKTILDIGIVEFKANKCIRTLIDLGYSELFAAYVVRIGKFQVAQAVASQPGLSMEMKCLAIFTDNDD